MAINVVVSVSGPTASVTGMKGTCDVSVHRDNGAKSNVWIEISHDAGVTWKKMTGGWLGNSEIDTTLIAGDSTVHYRFNVRGASGNTNLYLGND